MLLNSVNEYTDLKIYSSFVNGGTTACVCRKFHNFTCSDSTHVKINNLDSNIAHIFNNAKCSKLYPQKHGGFHVMARLIKRTEILHFCMYA